MRTIRKNCTFISELWTFSSHKIREHSKKSDAQTFFHEPLILLDKALPISLTPTLVVLSLLLLLHVYYQRTVVSFNNLTHTQLLPQLTTWRALHIKLNPRLYSHSHTDRQEADVKSSRKSKWYAVLYSAIRYPFVLVSFSHIHWQNTCVPLTVTNNTPTYVNGYSRLGLSTDFEKCEYVPENHLEKRENVMHKIVYSMREFGLNWVFKRRVSLATNACRPSWRRLLIYRKRLDILRSIMFPYDGVCVCAYTYTVCIV